MLLATTQVTIKNFNVFVMRKIIFCYRFSGVKLSESNLIVFSRLPETTDNVLEP